MAIQGHVIGFDSRQTLQSGQFRANLHKFSSLGVTLTMQISRHWRLNSQRYRLQGVRYQNGEVSLQARPAPRNHRESQKTEQITSENPVAVASR